MPIILNRYTTTQGGFTLIELMIVTAVIGILASIATVGYQTQVRKTQLVTIYQELNYFRMPYQIMMDDGAGVTEFSPNGLNIPEQTEYCQFSVTPPDVNGAALRAVNCQIRNLNYLQNQHISLDRAADGSWQCKASSGIIKAYLPKACR